MLFQYNKREKKLNNNKKNNCMINKKVNHQKKHKLIVITKFLYFLINKINNPLIINPK